MNLYKNGQKKHFKLFFAGYRTHFHSIEYHLNATQLAAESSWIQVDLAASSHQTSFSG
jgi:hypothetical protein